MSDGHSDLAKGSRVAREMAAYAGKPGGPVGADSGMLLAPSQDMPVTKTAPMEVLRTTWPETWMKVAHAMAERSYDPRLRVGAIVVSSDNTLVLSVGYNGNYRGGPHFHESPEPGESGFIHAEVNALVKCDFNFPKPKHMYVTHSPCRDCSKLIINAGIERFVFDHPYRDASGIELLRSVGIEVLGILDAIEAAIPKGR